MMRAARGVGKRNSADDNNRWQTHYTPAEVNEIEWTPKQLRTIITAIFPERGGRIERSTDEEDIKKEQENDEDNGGGSPRYNAYNRSGELIRKIVVNKEGKVMQVVKREGYDSNNNDDDGNNSIKLGLVSALIF